MRERNKYFTYIRRIDKRSGSSGHDLTRASEIIYAEGGCLSGQEVAEILKQDAETASDDSQFFTYEWFTLHANCSEELEGGTRFAFGEEHRWLRKESVQYGLEKTLCLNGLDRKTIRGLRQLLMFLEQNLPKKPGKQKAIA